MNENTSPDPQLEAALVDTYARHARKVGQPAGQLDDVLRRVAGRRNKRRALTAVTSVAIVVAGVVGIATLGRGNGAQAPTAAPASGPDTTLSYWFACDGALEVGGTDAYDSCELESSAGDPVWRCTGPLPQPTQDGDDRPRFASCHVIGSNSGPPPATQCVPMTVVPVTTLLPTPASTTPIDTTTPTSVEQTCTPDSDGSPGALPPPTTVTCGALPPVTVPTTPWKPCNVTAGSIVHGTAPATSVPLNPPPGTSQTPPTTTPGPAGRTSPLEQTYVIVAGDTLTRIADRFGITVDQLLAYNEWDADHLLLVGQPVKIPPGAMLPPGPEVLAIGDSVMVGAADVLNQRGWAVIAKVDMQPREAGPMLAGWREAGVISSETKAVIVHVGTNGTMSQPDLDAILAPLADVPNVLLYTIRADREWTDANNELLRSADQAGDNIVLIDFAVRSQECTDACFAGDGIHLNANGKEFYADLARDWTGR